MHPDLVEIPDRIIALATGALAQANMHSAFMDPGNEHWSYISILNAAHAGELFIKAAIAAEHPLLLFKDIYTMDDYSSEFLDIETMIKKGKTHDFEKLPHILWAATGIRIKNLKCFESVRKARNAIQHFCVPEGENYSKLSLEFIYSIIDPLIFDRFGLYAIQYHEDHNVGYDYLVGAIMRSNLKFSMPDDFDVGEISIVDEIKNAPLDYKEWLSDELRKIGKLHYLE